jgi:hypothetical protein
MSMIGNYLRVTPVEADRARRDGEWALQWAADLADAELDAPASAAGRLAAAQLFRTDKAWGGLRFLLLERGGCPVDVIYGEEEFTDEDWGYGPARLLSVDQVRVGSGFLTGMTFDALSGGSAVAELIAAAPYPGGWDQPDELDWLRGYYDDLTRFFAAAATAGDAMIVWLD